MLTPKSNIYKHIYTKQNDIISAFCVHSQCSVKKLVTKNTSKCSYVDKKNFNCNSSICFDKIITVLGDVKYTHYDISKIMDKTDIVHQIKVELAWMRSKFRVSPSIHKQTSYLAYAFLLPALQLGVDAIARRNITCACIILASKIENVEVITLENLGCDDFELSKVEFESVERKICKFLQYNLTFHLTPYVYISYVCENFYLSQDIFDASCVNLDYLTSNFDSTLIYVNILDLAIACVMQTNLDVGLHLLTNDNILDNVHNPIDVLSMIRILQNR